MSFEIIVFQEAAGRAALQWQQSQGQPQHRAGQNRAAQGRAGSAPDARSCPSMEQGDQARSLMVTRASQDSHWDQEVKSVSWVCGSQSGSAQYVTRCQHSREGFWARWRSRGIIHCPFTQLLPRSRQTRPVKGGLEWNPFGIYERVYVLRGVQDPYNNC